MRAVVEQEPHERLEPHVPHGAEAFSFWTHAASGVVSLAGLVALVLRADSTLARAAFAFYGATLVLLFASSALHHTFPAATPRQRLALRRLDHVAIYLLIMGTYTPVCVLALPPAVGLPVLGVVWGVGLVGIALKLFRPFAHRWVTVGLYVAMGWTALPVAGPLVRLFPLDALALLLGGGLAYTVGAVVYARKRPDPWPTVVGFHGLWHVFVMVGAGLQFAFVFLHVPAA